MEINVDANWGIVTWSSGPMPPRLSMSIRVLSRVNDSVNASTNIIVTIERVVDAVDRLVDASEHMVDTNGSFDPIERL